MSDRWSNPSGPLGIDRFRVWPAGSDSYNHVDNAANWDMADAIFGVPSAGTWPPTTGVDGGVYREVKILENERTPIGTVAPWFRPSGSIPIPTFWAVADGSTLTSGQHAFPGISGSVTLPDLRNAFILGADPTLSIGHAAALVTDPSINTAAGAPGAQAAGGNNQIIQTTSQMPSHTHTFTGTQMQAHDHYTIDNAFTGHNHNVSWFNNFATTASGNKAINDMGEMTGATSISGTSIPTTSADSAGTPTGTNSSTGSGNPMDNRPRWVGLIYIVKVLYSTTP